MSYYLHSINARNVLNFADKEFVISGKEFGISGKEFVISSKEEFGIT